ncbi:hypothetical protein LCGC14_0446710 [marine sediment metagenome]|uniref:Uncharacterized protein n=1 Tax=marine sediment metagenome TaxID=412755 RepID=A0A0F9SIW1_9ZZZZ
MVPAIIGGGILFVLFVVLLFERQDTHWKKEDKARGVKRPQNTRRAERRSRPWRGP